MSLNPLLLDPSQTALLRKSFAKEVVDPFEKLLNLIERERSTPQHLLTVFRDWLKKLAEGTWFGKKISLAYQGGVKRGLSLLGTTMEDRERKSVELFSHVAHRDREAAHISRAYGDLHGVITTQAKEIAALLGSGMTKEIEGTLVKRLTRLKDELLTIGLTEIVNAKLEGVLDLFATYGIPGVSRKPCPYCSDVPMKQIPLSQARGILPANTACLCSWLPVRNKFLAN